MPLVQLKGWVDITASLAAVGSINLLPLMTTEYPLLSHPALNLAFMQVWTELLCLQKQQV
jgi:hypothetical protein